MFHSRVDEGLPMGSASEFGPWGGHDSGKAHNNPFSLNGGRRSCGIYKTMNYKVLETQVIKRLKDAHNFLNKVELTPQDAHTTASLASALSDVGAALQQLDMEARGSPSGQALSSEVARYSEELKHLRQQSNAIRSRFARAEATAAHLGSCDLESVSSKLIGECNATVLQTEDLGLHIVEHLRSQRDTILKTNRLAEATGAEGARGRQTIVKIIRNHWLNRVILTATIIMLALCILLVLAHKSRLFRFPI